MLPTSKEVVTSVKCVANKPLASCWRSHLTNTCRSSSWRKFSWESGHLWIEVMRMRIILTSDIVIQVQWGRQGLRLFDWQVAKLGRREAWSISVLKRWTFSLELNSNDVFWQNEAYISRSRECRIRGRAFHFYGFQPRGDFGRSGQ